MAFIGAKHEMKGKEWNAQLNKGHPKDIFINKVRYASFVATDDDDNGYWVFPSGEKESDLYRASIMAANLKKLTEFCAKNHRRG